MTKQDNTTEEEQGGFGIIHQYIKDSSFENLLSPEDMLKTELNPEGEISLSVNSTPVEDDVYEVVVKIKIEAKDTQQNKDVYITELEYGALAHVKGFEDTETSGILMVEVPRLLFPYVRQNIAEITREGGFTPLVMGPVDFMGIWMNSIEAENDQ